MEPFQLPGEEEIRAAYEEGDEAVIGLFHLTVGQLAGRVQALEDRVSKDSSNSGKPVCSDGLAKSALKSLRKWQAWEEERGTIRPCRQHSESSRASDHITVHRIMQCLAVRHPWKGDGQWHGEAAGVLSAPTTR